MTNIKIKKLVKKQTQKGKEYLSILDTNGTWYNCFDYSFGAEWKEGDKIQVEVETSVNGDKTFNNIVAKPSKPKSQQLDLNKELMSIYEELTAIRVMLSEVLLKEKLVEPKVVKALEKLEEKKPSLPYKEDQGYIIINKNLEGANFCFTTKWLAEHGFVESKKDKGIFGATVTATLRDQVAEAWNYYCSGNEPDEDPMSFPKGELEPDDIPF